MAEQRQKNNENEPIITSQARVAITMVWCHHTTHTTLPFLSHHLIAFNTMPFTSLKDWFLGCTDATMDRILLLDGGVSTHLEAKGATFAHRSLWSSSLLLDSDDDGGGARIQAGHVDWFHDGGVNLISTVSYQLHYEARLWPADGVIRDDQHMDDLWQRAVQLGREVVDQVDNSNINNNKTERYHGLVASSGCYGAALANGAEYTGDYGPQGTPAAVQAFHQRKWQSMQRFFEHQDLRIDAVAIETVPSLLECHALRDMFQNNIMPAVTTIPTACWISLSCRNGEELNDGTPVRQALEVLWEIPINAVQAIGFNCCHAKDLPRLVGHWCAVAKKLLSPQQPLRGLVLYPNSGETWDATAADWTPGTASPDIIVERLMECVEQVEVAFGYGEGSSSNQNNDDASKPPPRPPRIIVGGCCRTTPTEMGVLRQAVDAHLQGEKK